MDVTKLSRLAFKAYDACEVGLPSGDCRKFGKQEITELLAEYRGEPNKFLMHAQKVLEERTVKELRAGEIE